MLKSLSLADLMRSRRAAVDPNTLSQAAVIVEDVRLSGDAALIEHAVRLGDLDPNQSVFVDPGEIAEAFESIDADDRAALVRMAERVERFARAQLASIHPLETHVPGGLAGHRIAPVERAGCYAPGGRYPLPSSVIMTALVARTAGVQEVWLASPRPSKPVLAAAHICGVSHMLRVGGSQAIAALAYGTETVRPCDAIVGPGNRWVTAAKRLVAGDVAIDMLAGPSELVVLADELANPEWIAADLLAQAEHDADAVPILITPSRSLADRVDAEVERQLPLLSTRATAFEALENGGILLVSDLDAGIEACNALAPEHLALHLAEACCDEAIPRLRHFGGLFIGDGCAEVFGDYGAGPNHTLPTGGTARSYAGLSVFTFLRMQTWMRLDSLDPSLIADTARLARMEGLDAHARSALLRLDRGA